MRTGKERREVGRREEGGRERGDGRKGEGEEEGARFFLDAADIIYF